MVATLGWDRVELLLEGGGDGSEAVDVQRKTVLWIRKQTERVS